MRLLIGRAWGEKGRGPNIGLRERTTFVTWLAENNLSKEKRKN